MTTFVVGNWKEHLKPDESVKLTKKLQEQIAPLRGTEVIICPPFLNLIPVYEVLERGHVKLGAQNANATDEGPLTGEVSAAMLAGTVDYVIVGHSERRLTFGETDKIVADKVSAVIRNELIPILCVGETKEERDAGASRRVVDAQVTAGLSGLTPDEASRVIIAYEPVWAIGSGAPAAPDLVQPVVDSIHHTMGQLYHNDTTPVLYGGSIEADNAGVYLKIKGVSGFLVGGASLKYHDFAAIVELTQNYQKSLV